MLDQSLAADREADTVPTPGASGPSPRDDRAIAAQVERCRRAFLEQGSDPARAGLQVIDLSRLRQRLGPRWPALKDRVLDVIHGTISRALGADDLCLEGGDQHLYLLRVGRDRAELARHGELLAAEATARLCGTIPGGTAIRVRTLAFDPDRGLADITSAAALRAQIECSIEPPESRGSASLEHRLHARFRPLLNPRKRLVSAYQLAGFALGPGDALAAFQLARSSVVDDDSAAELDLWSLKQALAALIPAPARTPVGLVVQVHYNTLAAMRWREGYIQLCRQLPPDSGRRLIFEVLELPAWLPQSRVRELMAYIRPFCGAIIVRLPTTSMSIEQLVATGIRGLSLVGAPTGTNTGAFAASLKHFSNLTRIHAMRSIVADLDAPSGARTAVAAGIDYVSGDALIPPLRHPERPFRLTVHH